jgi:hypothetical protein
MGRLWRLRGITNSVYPTPCTTAPSLSFGSASDKRYSLGVNAHQLA